MFVLELAKLVIHVVRVAALDARFPPAKPVPVLLLRKPAGLPEEEIRLCLAGRTEDVCAIYQPFLEEFVGGGINIVDAAIFVVGNPNQEAARKSPVVPQRLAGVDEMNGHLIAQERGIVVAAADGGPFDLDVLDESFNIVRGQLRADEN